MEEAKLYNGGDPIAETLIYSLPDGHDIHCAGHARVAAPKEGFFRVPLQIEVNGATVYTHFVKTLLDRHGHKGIVLVDANRDPATIRDNEYVAVSEAEAIRLGRKLWLDYCKEVVRAWRVERDEARSRGGAPRGATGFVKRALEVCGVQDPDEAVFGGAGLAPRTDLLPVAHPDPRIAALEAQIGELRRLVEKGGQPAAPAGSDEHKEEEGRQRKLAR